MTTSGTELIVAALEEIGVLSAGETSIPSEHTLMCLRRLNQIFGQRNTRPGLAKYVRSQSWPFAVARDYYTIGATADSPHFAVTAGGPPVEIESAFIVNTDNTPNTRLHCAVWTKQQYDAGIFNPAAAGSFPFGIYYQASFPLGVIFPWPANPTSTAFKLELNWPDQLVEIALADISTTLRLAPGLERDLVLQLAMALCLPFQKPVSRDLREQATLAATDFASRNRTPPKIATDGGFNSGGAWNPRSYRPF